MSCQKKYDHCTKCGAGNNSHRVHRESGSSIITRSCCICGFTGHVIIMSHPVPVHLKGRTPEEQSAAPEDVDVADGACYCEECGSEFPGGIRRRFCEACRAARTIMQTRAAVIRFRERNRYAKT